MTRTVRSADGSSIAYDRLGDGPPVILVGGAFSYRAFPQLQRLAELLAPELTVFNYDRRGRGDSTEAGAYSVGRELEDLSALIAAAGGRASLWGLSSGAVLALHAAEQLGTVDRLALYEPPLAVPGEGHHAPEDYRERLERLLAEGQRSKAAAYALKAGMGVPAPIVGLMRLMPSWKRLRGLAPSLAHDAAVLALQPAGRPLEASPWARLEIPALVIAGAKSPVGLRNAAAELARVLPQARTATLPGQNHVIKPEAIAPLLREFLAEDGDRRLAAAARA